MMSPDLLVLWVAVGVILVVVLRFVLTAIHAPIRVRTNNFSWADSGFEPCEGNDRPPEFIRTITALESLGFLLRGHWHLTGHSVATGQITLLEHPQSLDLVKVMISTAGNRRQFALLFQTRFDDGQEIVTANNPLTVGLPPLSETTVVWLPEVRDARQLHRVHVRIRDELARGRKRLAAGPDAAAFLHAGRERMLAHFVATGYYFLDESRGVYRPTWKGAVLMTWRLLWPIRPFYRAWRRRSTNKLLDQLDVQLEWE